MGYSHEEMRDLRCVSFTAKDNKKLLAAGLQNVMLIVDVEKGVVGKQVDLP